MSQLLCQVCVGGCHCLDAVVLFALFDHQTAFVTANNTEFTLLCMVGIVLLEHFFFTAKVCALDGSIVALLQMLLQVAIPNDHFAALVGVLARA